MLIVASQVGTDAAPAHPGVGSLEQHLAGEVKSLRVVRRKHDRLGPLKAVLHIGGGPADGIHGPGIHGLSFAGMVIVAGDLPTVRPCVHDFGIRGIGSDVAAFAAPDVVPIWSVDCAIGASAGDAHGGVVLLRAVNVIRKAIVGGDVIKLRGGLVVNAGPALRAVGGNGGAAVVAVDKALGVCRIDPEAVIVAVRHAQRIKSLAAIVRTVDAGVENVHGVGGFGIGEDVRVVPGALAEAVIVGEKLPVLAAIVGAVDATFLRFHNCPYAVRVCSGNSYADSSQNRFGQAVRFDLFPGRAAIRGAVQAAPGTAAIHAPGSAPRLPESREQNIRVAGIEGNVDRAGLGILI